MDFEAKRWKIEGFFIDVASAKYFSILSKFQQYFVIFAGFAGIFLRNPVVNGKLQCKINF